MLQPPQSRLTMLSRPADSPMSLDAGKPTPREALLTTGVTLAFILASTVGAWVAYLFAPKGYDEWQAWSFIGFLFGALTAVYCLMQSYAYGTITRKGWISYYSRLDDWHNAVLVAYEDMRGVETVTSIDVYSYDPAVPHHVFMTALAVHMQLTKGLAQGRQVPFSVRALDGPLMLGSNQANLIRVGELTGTVPERMANTLAEIGLIRGRRNNYAGEWVPSDLDELTNIFLSNWHKLGRRRVGNE